MGGGAACERCNEGEGFQGRTLVGVVLLVLAFGCFVGGAFMWAVLSGGWLTVLTSTVVLLAVGLGLPAMATTLLGHPSRQARSSR